MDGQVADAISRLETETGKRLGDPDDPLLVAVRSGARVSMPGMLDTVLNLGLNDDSVAGLARRSGDERFAWDCYRRFLQMFGNVVRGIDAATYEQAIEAVKITHGVRLDTELGVPQLRELAGRFKELFRERADGQFPTEPYEQLHEAIGAVFDSWNGERAIEYRRLNRIPDDWGTAVNVQQMVYGNMGTSSGSGVAFSRDELTGAPAPSGDFLLNAQGEDVVSGVRNTRDLSELAELMPDVHRELIDVLRRLERHFGDMQDVEFTVENGHLYILQARNAKRPAQAAVRFAADAVGEGLLDEGAALLTLDPDTLETLLHPTFDPEAEFRVLTRGVAASPGGAGGAIVFSAEEAVARSASGADVILVRSFTEAEDVAGFQAARGILTSEGGKASHAALVARGMGRPCVCGASELKIDHERGLATVGDLVLREGDWIAIDGSTGRITTDKVPLRRPEPSGEFETVLLWSDQLSRIGVRANADTPEDADQARRLGAQGVGLCRTEHMFMAPERQPVMRRMIMAADARERRRALDELEPMQQADFEGIFRAMSGLPVTIRLLDPPLHEFLPDAGELMVEIERLSQKPAGGRLAEAERELRRVRELEETNPMLGTRGCRLAISFPEIYEMQVRAIVRAAVALQDEGETPSVGIMIPLVDYAAEVERMRELLTRTAEATFADGGTTAAQVPIGTMIELPRACLAAGAIALVADFFSFGTNDLTQTSLGFSRDDAEGGFLADYLRAKIIDSSPFESIDVEGVGELVRIAVERGRASQAGARSRGLWRTWRGSAQHQVLRRSGSRLCQLLPVSSPDRPHRGSASRIAGGSSRDRAGRTRQDLVRGKHALDQRQVLDQMAGSEG